MEVVYTTVRFVVDFLLWYRTVELYCIRHAMTPSGCFSLFLLGTIVTHSHRLAGLALAVGHVDTLALCKFKFLQRK